MKIIAKFRDILTDSEGNSIASFIFQSYRFNHLLQGLDKSKDYSIEIKEIKSKRSLQQNSYMWALLREIDIAINGRPCDDWAIYIQALEKANIKYDYLYCTPEAEEKLKEAFRAVKFVRSEIINGEKMNLYKCFMGSSKFTKEEMALLIDTILDMADEAGIEDQYWKEVLQ